MLCNPYFTCMGIIGLETDLWIKEYGKLWRRNYFRQTKKYLWINQFKKNQQTFLSKIILKSYLIRISKQQAAHIDLFQIQDCWSGQHKEEKNRLVTNMLHNSNSRLPVNWPVILKSFLRRISKIRFRLKTSLIRISEQHEIQIDWF